MAESIADLEDALLRAMLIPEQSIADLANACGWRTSAGEPYKSKVQRVVKRLEKDKLVTTKRGVATLTEAGKTAANEIKAASDHLATLKAIKDHSEFDENEIEFGRAAVAMMDAGYCGSLPLDGNVCHARIPANGIGASSARRLASCRRRPAR